MNHHKNIVVVGASNWDMFTYCDKFPKPGETIKGTDFKVSFGGKAANQAVQASKLGSNVSIITKLGDDVSGKNTLENFKQQNVNISNLSVVPNVPSGCASIIVDKNGENQIIIVGGSNSLLSQEDIDKSSELIMNSDYLLCQLEISLNTTLSALKIAKRSSSKSTTILNATPITSDKIFKEEILNYVDILIVNEIELYTLSETEKENSQPSHLEEIQNIYKISELILKQYKNISNILITLGGRGQVLVSKEIGNHFIEITEKVKVVDTTGAGDSFIGSFAHYLLETNKDIIESIKKASKVASLSVQKYGTQTSYPSKDDL